MGLDWCLRCDDTDKSPLELLGAERCDLKNEEHVSLVKGIIASYKAALPTHTHLPAFIEYWSRPEEEIMKDMEGNILTDTIDETIPEIALSSKASPFRSLSGLEAFRGKRVQSSYNDLVSEELDEASFSELSPKEMLVHAAGLEVCLPPEDEWKDKYDKCFDPDGKIKEGVTPSTRMLDIDDIIAAVKWLRFWADYPVRMVPWY